MFLVTKKTTRRSHSGLEDHRRHKKRLQPPWLAIPKLESLDGARDLLPELLWIDALYRVSPERSTMDPSDAVMEVLERVNPSAPPRLGLISDLRLPRALHAQALDQLSKQERLRAFPSPFHEAMALYPDFPGLYLLQDLIPTADTDTALEWLRESVFRLIDRRSKTGARANVLAIRGMFRANAISIPNDDSLINALSVYPRGTDDQTGFIEGFARSSLNALSGQLSAADHAWSMHFWRRNAELSSCRGAR
jgi:hypothetical protein